MSENKLNERQINGLLQTLQRSEDEYNFYVTISGEKKRVSKAEAEEMINSGKVKDGDSVEAVYAPKQNRQNDAIDLPNLH